MKKFYVVTNEGRDIEIGDGLTDAIIKRLGLRPLLNLLEFLFGFLVDFIQNEIKNYQLFMSVKNKFDEIMKVLEVVFPRKAV